MNICLLIDSLSLGGAERVAVTLAEYWAKKGWRVTVVTIEDERKDFYVLHPSVCRVALGLNTNSKNPAKRIWNNFSRTRALRRVLKHHNPNIAIGFMPMANVLLAIATLGMDVKTFGSEHTHPPYLTISGFRSWLRIVTYRNLSGVTALTEKSAIYIRKDTFASLVRVIPNPITYPLSAHEPRVPPTSIWLKKERVLMLLAVGRLMEYKGFDRLLNAFAEIAGQFPEWRLSILGEGPLRKELEQRASDLGIAGKVALPGAVGNVGEWYEAADLYVLTSRFEGFGNTLAEALAYGVPAVAVDCETGPREILRHEVDGLLVPQDDPQALVDALTRLMEEDTLRRRFAEKAVDARERFAVEHIASKWEELFKEVVSPV